MPPGQSLRQQRLDETEVGDAKGITISDCRRLPAIGRQPHVAADLGLPPVGSQGLVQQDTYESIYNAGKLLLLASWRSADAAGHGSRCRPTGRTASSSGRVVRDYGMFERREAPQYYREVRR